MSAMFAVCGIWGIQNSNNMTTEEKAKAYDEAVRLGSNILKNTTCEVALALKQVIPALDKTESEDEKMRRELLEYAKGQVCSYNNMVSGDYDSRDKEDKKMHEWWKKIVTYLEKQKEQKPAEWSEEDERLLTKLMTFVDIECFDRECNGQDVIAWLKSLRPQPHWKPSEEQMGALNYAYCELFKRQDVGHNILGPLQNLIDTLRKL